MKILLYQTDDRLFFKILTQAFELDECVRELRCPGIAVTHSFVHRSVLRIHLGSASWNCSTLLRVRPPPVGFTDLDRLAYMTLVWNVWRDVVNYENEQGRLQHAASQAQAPSAPAPVS